MYVCVCLCAYTFTDAWVWQPAIKFLYHSPSASHLVFQDKSLTGTDTNSARLTYQPGPEICLYLH